MVPGVEGGVTRHMPSGEVMSIYDAAMRYGETKTPLVVIAGKEYGTGSSRDWAAKGPRLLGVTAVIAESFERIHRSNLIGMGILPLEFIDGATRTTLKLVGDEVIDIKLPEKITPGMQLQVAVKRKDGSETKVPVLCRIDTLNEAEYYRHGGILHYMLRKMV
jgi:aconitate hydratase